ncbi:hypothetical protein ABIA35_003346 [Catenulispora sp. MAP12-49]|uniref:hypothetical protein n=1 Tax=unclassified Catenulispora TaxID=414885 RepID=UPI00351307CA
MQRIGITGHRQFDEPTTRLIRAALRRVVEAYQGCDLIGVTCLAEGSDTLFAEAVADRGGRLEVVVPAVRYRETLPATHQDAYDEWLARATEVHRLAFFESDDAAYLAGGEQMLMVIDRLIAVWDGLPARGIGGTGDIVQNAYRRGLPVEVVWPDGALRAAVHE